MTPIAPQPASPIDAPTDCPSTRSKTNGGAPNPLLRFLDVKTYLGDAHVAPDASSGQPSKRGWIRVRMNIGALVPGVRLGHRCLRANPHSVERAVNKAE